MKKKKGKRAVKNKIKFNKLIIIIPSILLVIIFFLLITFNKRLSDLKKYANKYISSNKYQKELGKKNISAKYNLSKSYYITYPKFSNDNLDNIINEEKDVIIKNVKDNSIKDRISELFIKSQKYSITDYEVYNGIDGVISVAFIETKFKNKKDIEYKKVYTINLDPREKEILNDTYMFIGDYKTKFTEYIDNYLNSNEELKGKLTKNYKKIISKDNSYKYVVSKDGIVVYFDSNKIVNSNYIIKINIPYKEIISYLNIDTEIIYKNIKDIKETKEEFKDSKKNMYLKRTSNIYSKSSKNSKILDTIDKGSKVEILKSSDNYSIIKYKEKDGYILNKYLSDEIVSDLGYTDVVETVYASEEITIRKKSDDTSDELVKLALGDSITRIGTNDDGWSEVVYNNEKGFIKSNYLSLVKPSKNVAIRIDKNRNVNAHGGMVALTFDDGPNPSSTGRILDTLEKYHVVATFFDLGKLAQAYPSVVKREESIGCEVASHSYDHPNLNNLSAESVQAQVNSSKEVFMNVLGHDVSLFRPPYGNANAIVKTNVPYPLINWNVDTLDWKSKNKDAILNEVRTVGNLDGKIVLMHSIHETTADAVEALVPELLQQGYQLVTVSELAYYKGASLNAGQMYYGF